MELRYLVVLNLPCALLQVKVLKNIQGVTMIVITLREQFPRANISAILKIKPKLLLGSAARIQEDAKQVSWVVKVPCSLGIAVMFIQARYAKCYHHVEVDRSIGKMLLHAMFVSS